MSDDDSKYGELLPPDKPPARRAGILPSVAPERKSVVGSVVTGFQADMNRRAWDKQAQAERAKQSFLDARTGVIESFRNVTLAADRLNELGDDMNSDRRVRALERQEREAEAERRARQSQNYRDYVVQTGAKNIEIHVAARDEKLSEIRGMQEPAAPDPADPLQELIDSLVLEIQAKRARGEDVGALCAKHGYLMAARDAGRKK